MRGHKPNPALRLVLRAGSAPPEQLAGAELFHCDMCDEAPSRLHPEKVPAMDTFNHEELPMLEVGVLVQLGVMEYQTDSAALGAANQVAAGVREGLRQA